MALSAAALSAALRAKLLARGWFADDAIATEFCDDLADTIVSHITANAVVLPLLLVAPPGGGPVTGTGVVA